MSTSSPSSIGISSFASPTNSTTLNGLTSRSKGTSTGSPSSTNGNGVARSAKGGDGGLKVGPSGGGWWERYEVPRKVLHSSIGFLTLTINYFDPPSTTPIVRVLAIGMFLVALIDGFRLHVPWFATLYEKYLGALMRAEEKKKINGVVWYLLGVIFVLTFYPRDIAIVSILILSWADTSASTIGRLFSSSPYNPKLPRRIFFNTIPIARSKSLVGFLAAWLTGLAIGVGYYGGIDEYGGGRSRGGAVDWRVLEWKRGVALTGMMVGAVAAVTEALEVGQLDDNLTLPIVSGGMLWAWLAATSKFL